MDSNKSPELEIDRLRELRAELRTRHAQALTTLMVERDDLRGVHALADHFDDARWRLRPGPDLRPDASI